MKKLFTLILLLVAVCLNGFALSESAIILHHGEEVTVFDGPSHLQEALDKAVDGDILFLSKGSYDGFAITKKILVRGAGEEMTQINGNVNIMIDDDDVEFTEPVLEGLYIPNNYIQLYYNTTGVTVRKCKVSNVKMVSGSHVDLTIDRCWITGMFYYSKEMQKLSVVNSKINQFYFSNSTTNDDVVIMNSYIYEFDDYISYFRGSIFNSVIGKRSDYYKYNTSNFQNMTMVNTLLGASLGMASTVHKENCWQVGKVLLQDSLECIYDKDTMIENGYIGTDGTVVGCYGGATPFTLKLDVPAVTESKIEVDNAKKKLNVSITVGNAQ